MFRNDCFKKSHVARSLADTKLIYSNCTHVNKNKDCHWPNMVTSYETKLDGQIDRLKHLNTFPFLNKLRVTMRQGIKTLKHAIFMN